jgi:hypothetical protein
MQLNLVPANTGAQWVLASVRTFFKRPVALIGLFLMFVATLSLVAIIPLAGIFIALALVPAFTVGLMAGTREVEAGNFPFPNTLFVALRQGQAETRAMLLLGALYALAVLGILGITALIDGGNLAQLYLGHVGLSEELVEDPALRTAMWISTLLYLPVSLAFWHAPALVHWHAVPPVKSLFFSFVAVLRNVRAFLVYGALWLMLSFGAGMALLAFMLLNSSSAGATMVATAMFPLSLVLAAIFFTSLWFTFRDCFADDDTLPPVDHET